jgi:hypothetical protein
VTIYVYPVSQEAPNTTLQSQFDACKREVVTHHNSAVIVAESAVTVAGGQQRNGQFAAFTFTGLFANRQQALRSELYLFVEDQWFIKYRVSYPIGQQLTAEPAIKSFIEELKWHEPGKN